jgi:pyridoxine 5-phosphate synthase
MALLSVNIDHVATLRNARYKAGAGSGSTVMTEPDPVRAAHEAEMGGADGITVHLREDRRHIIDADVERLRGFVRSKFNLEMAATDEMVSVAERLRPHTAMLVPEGRNEVTTEGGLDVAATQSRLVEVVRRLKAAGCFASAFIDADERQIRAAHACGFDICEIHTGPYAHAYALHGGDFRNPELARQLSAVSDAGNHITNLGMRFNAGHALNYANVAPIARLAQVEELHIGHAIVSRAIYAGMRCAVADMKAAMRG